MQGGVWKLARGKTLQPPSYLTTADGKVPGVIYAEDLEGVFQSMAQRFPHAVRAAA